MNAASSDLADALSIALENELDMDAADACEIAHIVAETFGGAEEVDDDALPQDLRSIFYTLQKQRWLTFRREEVRNEDGALRRAFFWSVRWDDLMEAAETRRRTPTPVASSGGVSTVYDSLPQNAWRRGISA